MKQHYSLKPTVTFSPSTTNGRLINLPLPLSNFIICSSLSDLTILHVELFILDSLVLKNSLLVPTLDFFNIMLLVQFQSVDLM
ncbi:MAG: hypothetical protein U0T83_04550 [Bacteriovoracaceae bacterium]